VFAGDCRATTDPEVFVCVYGDLRTYCADPTGTPINIDQVLACFTTVDGDPTPDYAEGDCDGDMLANALEPDFERDPCVSDRPDAGTTSDAGAASDAGSITNDDAGPVRVDAGPPPVDASIPLMDAGMPEYDAGGEVPDPDGGKVKDPEEPPDTRPGANYEFRGKGGCSCRLTPTSHGWASGGWLVLLGSAVLWRRRRRSR